jgi:hypothetical protein
MAEPNVKEREATTVKVDGEEAVMHITDQSVMFEKGGKVSGFLRSAIQMVKPDGDSMLIAYAVGSEVKSVRVVPITAVTPLLVPGFHSGSGSGAGQVPASATALDEVYERLYREARTELEERLASVQDAPENMSLRLTADDRKRYDQVFEQMTNIIAVKRGMDPRDLDSLLSFWSLEEQSYDLQLAQMKAEHIKLLIELTASNIEAMDSSYSDRKYWPWDVERALARFNLMDGPLLTHNFETYLRSKWTIRESDKKPSFLKP